MKWCGHHFLLRNCFLYHVLIWSTRIFLYCRKVATTLLRCQNEWMNVAIVLWRCFAATLWQRSWNFPGICCSNLICQRFHNPPTNVVETLLQPYIVSWHTTAWFRIFFIQDTTVWSGTSCTPTPIDEIVSHDHHVVLVFQGRTYKNYTYTPSLNIRTDIVGFNL